MRRVESGLAEGDTLIRKILERVWWFLRHEDGQGLMEYGMILVLVSIASMAILTALGTSVLDLFGKVIPLPGSS